MGYGRNGRWGDSTAAMSGPAFDDAATRDDIAACFRLLLGRNPNPEEVSGHMSAAGQPLDRVVANYLNSMEFSRRGLLAAPGGEVTLVSRPDYRIYASAADGAVGLHVVKGAYEVDVEAVLRRHLRPGMGMLDLGANIGVFSLLAAALVGPSGSVLAMEPNPANARLLEASRRENGFVNLTVYQAAAAANAGVLVLHSFDSNGTVTELDGAGLLTAQTVAALPVDQIVGPDTVIDVIKIDVEGGEYGALQGAAGLITRCHPVIVSEFSPGQLRGVSGVDGPAYLGFLQALGYRLGVIGPGGAYTLGMDAAAVMAAYDRSGVDHIDIVAEPSGRAPGAASGRAPGPASRCSVRAGARPGCESGCESGTADACVFAASVAAVRIR